MNAFALLACPLLALALGPKPALTAACDATLTALAQALAKRGSAATR